jgi:hypothetical protein
MVRVAFFENLEILDQKKWKFWSRVSKNGNSGAEILDLRSLG